MFSIKINGDAAMQARFTRLPSNVRTELVKEVTKQTLLLERLVKQKLSGPVLKVRTGNLRASIHSRIEDNGTDTIKGYVGSSGDVKYAAIHEFGGVIKHPGGTPYMAFEGRVFWVSKAKALNLNLPVTKPHDIPMPERSYLRSSLADRRYLIVEGMQDALKRGLAK